MTVVFTQQYIYYNQQKLFCKPDIESNQCKLTQLADPVLESVSEAPGRPGGPGGPGGPAGPR